MIRPWKRIPLTSFANSMNWTNLKTTYSVPISLRKMSGSMRPQNVRLQLTNLSTGGAHCAQRVREGRK